MALPLFVPTVVYFALTLAFGLVGLLLLIRSARVPRARGLLLSAGLLTCLYTVCSVTLGVLTRLYPATVTGPGSAPPEQTPLRALTLDVLLPAWNYGGTLLVTGTAVLLVIALLRARTADPARPDPTGQRPYQGRPGAEQHHGERYRTPGPQGPPYREGRPLPPGAHGYGSSPSTPPQQWPQVPQTPQGSHATQLPSRPRGPEAPAEPPPGPRPGPPPPPGQHRVPSATPPAMPRDALPPVPPPAPPYEPLPGPPPGPPPGTPARPLHQYGSAWERAPRPLDGPAPPDPSIPDRQQPTPAPEGRPEEPPPRRRPGRHRAPDPPS